MSVAELTHLSLFSGIGGLDRKWNAKKKCGVPTDQSRDTAQIHTAGKTVSGLYHI